MKGRIVGGGKDGREIFRHLTFIVNSRHKLASSPNTMAEMSYYINKLNTDLTNFEILSHQPQFSDKFITEINDYILVCRKLLNIMISIYQILSDLINPDILKTLPSSLEKLSQSEENAILFTVGNLEGMMKYEYFIRGPILKTLRDIRDDTIYAMTLFRHEPYIVNGGLLSFSVYDEVSFLL